MKVLKLKGEEVITISFTLDEIEEAETKGIKLLPYMEVFEIQEENKKNEL